MRLSNDAAANVQEVSAGLMDRAKPGESNQALMELGALVCLPREPLCGECPWTGECEARRHGTTQKLPPKKTRRAPERIARTLLVIRREGKILLVPSERVRGFWDLPEPFPGARAGRKLGMFRHTILHRQYIFKVKAGVATKVPAGSGWWSGGSAHEIPLSTTAKKALRCLQN
jgi:A/G-specific adenine glycosylase